VVGRVEQALADTSMVLRTRTTFSPSFPTLTQWDYHHDVRLVQPGFTGPGGPVNWADGTATINGKRTYVQVDYGHHEWRPEQPPAGAPTSCTSRLSRAEGFVTGPEYVRHMLACGKLKVAGHAWVDGKKTIRITGSMTEPADQEQGFLLPMRVHATFYVDPSTYLPAQVIWRNWSHTRNGLMRGDVREDIQALPPTPANIATATVTIPAGFRKVHHYLPGGPIVQQLRLAGA
jgi:hypothetical protein